MKRTVSVDDAAPLALLPRWRPLKYWEYPTLERAHESQMFRRLGAERERFYGRGDGYICENGHRCMFAGIPRDPVKCVYGRECESKMRRMTDDEWNAWEWGFCFHANLWTFMQQRPHGEKPSDDEIKKRGWA